MARKQYPEDEGVPIDETAGLRNRGEPGTPRTRIVSRSELEGEPAGLDLDARGLDLEPEQESPFLRAQKRVPVRRGPLPKKAANRLKYALVAVCVVAVVAVTWAALARYGRRSWRFRLESSDQIQITGNHNVSRTRLVSVFGGDISRNVFLIPLEERKRQLEQVPWIESATVMRLLPNRLRVDVRERTPIAFVRVGKRIALADGNGVIMDVPVGNKSYSFPVIVGISGAEPLSTRAARMKIYKALLAELDSGGANYSRDVSEVDLSDPEDVKITVADPQGDVLVHLGASDFLERFKIYKAHVQEWRQQFDRLSSVDLRYDRQVIVNPDAPREPPAAAVKPPVAKSAVARPAAKTRSTTRNTTGDR
ncbi:MAG: cell division protein FtsQ/DivIB [Terriglobales bacterium]